MKFPEWIEVYGDTSYRGPCPHERVEQKMAIELVRIRWPNSWGLLAIHPRNEGRRTHRQASQHKAEGLTPGAPDLMIPAPVPCLIEIKRRDHTLCTLQASQELYLRTAKNNGCFVALALGVDGVVRALDAWAKTMGSLQC